MEKKQTAVGWLEEQIKDIFYVAEASEMTKKFKSVYEQAKQIEKEQIENAWDKRCSYGVVSQTWRVETTNGEQYYNETYGETKK